MHLFYECLSDAKHYKNFFTWVISFIPCKPYVVEAIIIFNLYMRTLEPLR